MKKWLSMISFLIIWPALFLLYEAGVCQMYFYRYLKTHSLLQYVRTQRGAVLECLVIAAFFVALSAFLRGRICVRWKLTWNGRSFFLQAEHILTLVMVLIAVLLAASALRQRNRYEKNSSEIAAVKTQLARHKAIAHGGCIVLGRDGQIQVASNSKEAVKNCVNRGIRVIELDFLRTEDGDYICAHDWKQVLDENGEKRKNAVALKEAMTGTGPAGLTLLCMDDVIALMRAFEDLIIVTDMKDDVESGCRTLLSRAPELRDRFVIQIYHAAEYEKVYRLGFHNIIFTLYAAKKEERDISVLRRFGASHDLVGFTVRDKLADRDNFMKQLVETLTPVYVHRINAEDDKKGITETERDIYLKKGAKAIYADLLRLYEEPA